MLLKTITENIINKKHKFTTIPNTFKIYSETLYGLSTTSTPENMIIIRRNKKKYLALFLSLEIFLTLI